MRVFLIAVSLVVTATLLPTGPVRAQSLDGGLASGLGGGISSGLGSGIASGLAGTLGSTQAGRSRAQIDPRDPIGNGGCALGQFDLNHTGCRPLRELSRNSISTYDTSIQAMQPLGGMVLDRLTLDPGGGPAMAESPN